MNKWLKKVWAWFKSEEESVAAGSRKLVYGWIRDETDFRDLKYARSASVVIPASVDLRPNDNPVYEQSDLGSCQSNAAIGNVQFLEKKDGLPAFMLSRLELYYNTRVLQDTVKVDSGGSLRNCIKVLVKQGGVFGSDLAVHHF